MAKARGLRPRTLAGIFGAYFLLAILLAYFLSPTVSPYVDPGATSWICAAYMLLGAVVLVGVCAGAVRRWMHLEAHLAELEDAQSEALSSMFSAPEAAAPPAEEHVPASEPTDRDVDQLLEDLHRLGQTAAAADAPPPERAARPFADPRSHDGVEAEREIRRVRRVLEAVPAFAAGPAFASSVLLGVFASLLPASDGMLVANLQLNAFVGVAGLACLVGLLAYAGAAFRQVGRGAA
jgi:hypothetical protein